MAVSESASDNVLTTQHLPRGHSHGRENPDGRVTLFWYPSRRADRGEFAGCVVCAVVACLLPAYARATDSDKVRILFPAYGNPHHAAGREMWEKLCQLSHDRPEGLEIDVIFNPASGPGKARDPNYLRDDGSGPLADAQGLRIVGYVTTAYAKRPAEDVRAEIDRYATGFYAGYVSGIFFDETSSDLNTAPYYRALSQYAHSAIKPSHGRRVITISNPGIGEVQAPVTQQQLQAYATAMDRTVVFENAAERYMESKAVAIQPFLSADNLVHIMHTQASWSPDLVTAIRQRGAANLFITDDVMQNPYDRLPVYFDQLCDSVAAANRSQ